MSGAWKIIFKRITDENECGGAYGGVRLYQNKYELIIDLIGHWCSMVTDRGWRPTADVRFFPAVFTGSVQLCNDGIARSNCIYYMNAVEFTCMG